MRTEDAAVSSKALPRKGANVNKKFSIETVTLAEELTSLRSLKDHEDPRENATPSGAGELTSDQASEDLWQYGTVASTGLLPHSTVRERYWALHKDGNRH
jgi:hypothetical protein